MNNQIDQLVNKISAVGLDNIHVDGVGNIDGIVTLTTIKEGKKIVLAKNITNEAFNEAVKIAKSRVILG